MCWELLYRTWPCEDRHFGSVSTAKIQLSPEVHLQKRHTVLSHRIFFLQVLACSVFLVGQKAIEITCWECQMDDQLNFYINNFFSLWQQSQQPGLDFCMPLSQYRHKWVHFSKEMENKGNSALCGIWGNTTSSSHIAYLMFHTLLVHKVLKVKADPLYLLSICLLYLLSE